MKREQDKAMEIRGETRDLTRGWILDWSIVE